MYAQKHWRRGQHLAQEFWAKWAKTYLDEFQSRQKWGSSQFHLSTLRRQQMRRACTGLPSLSICSEQIGVD
jgi:hypothetical protein